MNCLDPIKLDIRKTIQNMSNTRNILMCFYKFRKHPCVHNCKAILYAVSNYFLGSRITNLFGKQSEDNRIERVFYPMKEQVFFHWAPINRLDLIKTYGLCPGRNLNYVYLTDEPYYIAKTGYLYWRAYQEQADMKFVCVRVDGNQLLKCVKIYQLDDPHEFVVKYVPRECIRYFGAGE